MLSCSLFRQKGIDSGRMKAGLLQDILLLAWDTDNHACNAALCLPPPQADSLPVRARWGALSQVRKEFVEHAVT